MRLIDADAMRTDWLENGENEYVYDTNAVLESIDAQPTINAVEVVRCKECKHWGTAAAGETDHVKQCEYGSYMVGESGYCVYGEMKKDEK
jgi:hypothetical protein